MTLRSDWFARLNACIDGYRGRPFVFGESDCLHFAADCVRAITGVDHLGTLRGAYSSSDGGARAVMGLGYRSLADLAEASLAHLGGAVDVDLAAPGDVGVTETDALCIRGLQGWLARSQAGELVVVPCVKAWRVG